MVTSSRFFWLSLFLLNLLPMSGLTRGEALVMDLSSRNDPYVIAISDSRTLRRGSAILGLTVDLTPFL